MFDNKNSGLHGKNWKTMQENLENLKLVIIGKYVTSLLVVILLFGIKKPFNYLVS